MRVWQQHSCLPLAYICFNLLQMFYFLTQERFHLVKKYEVEFNKAAISLADQMTNPQQKKATMNRLLKVSALGWGMHARI